MVEKVFNYEPIRACPECATKLEIFAAEEEKLQYVCLFCDVVYERKPESRKLVLNPDWEFKGWVSGEEFSKLKFDKK